MPLSLDQMRAQMTEILGTSPIPEPSLNQYATMVAGLSAVITATAKDVSAEDDVAGFKTFLESFAEGQNDAS
jgi:hypothetical protein